VPLDTDRGSSLSGVRGRQRAHLRVNRMDSHKSFFTTRAAIVVVGQALVLLHTGQLRTADHLKPLRREGGRTGILGKLVKGTRRHSSRENQLLPILGSRATRRERPAAARIFQNARCISFSFCWRACSTHSTVRLSNTRRPPDPGGITNDGSSSLVRDDASQPGLEHRPFALANTQYRNRAEISFLTGAKKGLPISQWMVLPFPKLHFAQRSW
jgi:hypothetical protein